jgi:hypothetical protein
VVHQVRDAGNRGRRERQLIDELRPRVGRRRGGRVLRGVDVVREADGDTALGRGGEGALDRPGQAVREVEVVDRDLERPLGCRDELGERLRRPLGRLAAVDERRELDQDAFARMAALCARFAAW